MNTKILIVEDEALIALDVKTTLENLGHEVCGTIRKGEELEDAVNRFSPDLILLDIILAGKMDGIDAIGKVQKSITVPHIFMSGNADPQTVLRARKTNPFGYLNKPVRMRDLQTNIDAAMMRYSYEERIRSSENRNKVIFNSVNDAIFIHDSRTGEILDVNHTTEQMYGYSVEEIKNMTIADLSLNERPYTREEALAWMRKTVSEGSQLFEWKACSADGRIFWVEVNMKAVDLDGEERIILAVRDIDKRKKMEEQLIEEKEISDKLISSLPGMFYVVSGSGVYFRWNSEVEKVSGYTSEEIKKISPVDVICDKDRGRVISEMKKVIDTGSSVVELGYRCKSGDIIPYLFTGARVNISGENMIIGIGLDISKQKQMQEQNRELNIKLIHAVEEERKKLSSDLHDSVAQTLLAAKINLEEYKDNPERNKERFDLALQFVSQGIDEIREMYTDLYPAILRDLGLKAAVKWLAKKMLEPNGIKVKINLTVRSEIPSDTGIHLYRITQEAFSNIVRHSGADTVDVKLKYRNSSNFTYSITDNGIGLKQKDNTGTGNGLVNMRYRASFLDCSLDITGNVNEGVQIKLKKINDE